MSHLTRQQVFPEAELPDAAALIAEGRSMAKEVTVGRSPFLEKYEVPGSSVTVSSTARLKSGNASKSSRK